MTFGGTDQKILFGKLIAKDGENYDKAIHILKQN